MERVTWKLNITTGKVDRQWEFPIWLRNSNGDSLSTARGGVGREMGEKFKKEGICVANSG